MLSQAEALTKLRAGEVEFQPLELIGFDAEPGGIDSMRPDWLVQLRWAGRTEGFAVEFKSPATPKRLREAAAQVRGVEAGGVRPMVMAPYLGPDALDWLAEQGVSGVDFSGNAVIVVPEAWFIYRTGQPNAYPSSQYIKSIYRGRSSLVARVLLVRRGFDTVTEVRDEVVRRGGRISLGTVSKVLQSLEEELLVGRDEGVSLLQPGQLLDRLTENFERPAIRRRLGVRAEAPGPVMTKIMERARAGEERVAAGGERAWTVFPGSEQVLSVYVEELDDLTEPLDLTETRRFPDLELLETGDELVFFDRRCQDELIWTSPLQTYLELATGDKREREIASGMREDLVTGALV